MKKDEKIEQAQEVDLRSRRGVPSKPFVGICGRMMVVQFII